MPCPACGTGIIAGPAVSVGDRPVCVASGTEAPRRKGGPHPCRSDSSAPANALMHPGSFPCESRTPGLPDRRDHVVGPLLHELELDFLPVGKLVEQRLVPDGESHVHGRPFHALDRTVRDRHLAAGGIELLHRACALVNLALRFLVLAHVHSLHVHPAHALGAAQGNHGDGQSENGHCGETGCFFHVSTPSLGLRIELPARGRRNKRYATGTTNIESSGAVIIPPTMGAAMRRINSEPVPEPNMMGRSPAMMTATVMATGRTRSAAPSTMANANPRSSRSPPAASCAATA